MSKDKIINLPLERKSVEQMSDIRWCRSTFLKYSDTMEENFMKDEVIHAYHLCNTIRIESKGDNELVYFESLKTLGIYGDLLYGKDIRLTFWKKRMTEHGYDKIINELK